MGIFIKPYSVLCFLIAGHSLAVAHEKSANADWVEAKTSRTIPGQKEVAGKTFFSPSFSKTHGQFRALYESALDTRDKIQGDFIIGKFLYKYAIPIGSNKSKIDPLHDEVVSEVVMDCKQHFYGVKKSTFYLKGRIVFQINENDVLLTEDHMPSTTVADLCDFAKDQKAW